MLALTLGRGLTNPTGRTVVLPKIDVLDAYAWALERHQGYDAWWSSSVFEYSRRRKLNWRSASAIVVDLDFHDETGARAQLNALWKIRLSDVLERCALPGQLLHLTPRGMRVVYLYSRQVNDRRLHRRCIRSALEQLQRAMGEEGILRRPERSSERAQKQGLTIDRTASADIAHMYWAPMARVGRQKRKARIYAGARLLVVPERLAQEAPRKKPQRMVPLRKGKAYVRAAVFNAERKVSGAQEGARNITLNTQVFRLAKLGAQREEVEQRLLAAAISAGLSQRESMRTFESAWYAGAGLG